MELLIGFDVGGTNLKSGLFDEQLNLLAKDNRPNPRDLSADSMVEHIVRCGKELLLNQGFSQKDLKAAGIGCPGAIDMKNGIVRAAPNLPFRNTPMRDMVAERMNCPCILENDANAAAWGEFTAGAAKEVCDMVFFTLGTGIGGGVVCDGKLIRGFSGEAGELGHIIIYPDGDRLCGCGQKGCAEAYASANNTADIANEQLARGAESSLLQIFKKNGGVSCKDVFDHAKKGDRLATDVVDGAAKVLGLLCVNILHVTQPQRIVFAGGMIAAGDFLLEKIRAQFDKYVWTMKKESLDICFAALGEDAGIYGAAALALLQYNKAIRTK